MQTDHNPSLPQAQQLLQTMFGYAEFRYQQADIIEAVLAGKDALALMPTGGGKSLCYQIPALLRNGVGIVVSPLIALMQDQVDALQQLGIRAAYLNSTLSFAEVQEIEQAMQAGEVDLVYIAPERLLAERTLMLLEQLTIALFAIDEAHCVSQWGHDFRREYQQLNILHQRFPGVPRIALTATADQRTREEIIEQLNLHQAAVFVSSFDRPNICYTITEGQNGRSRLWQFLQREHPHDAGIVYCLSRKKVESIANWLNEKGRVALAYHAGLPDSVRRQHQQRFLREEGVIVVATIAFGMGIDKPDVRFVAHLNMPKSLEAYYQETGRAGRDGEPANAWLYYGLQDVITLRQMMQESTGDEQYKRVSHQKLESMLGLCELTSCRRLALLGYFGEHREKPCGNCDNCLIPPETWDGTEAAQKALSCVYRTGQRFGVNYVIDVLQGKSDDRIRRFGHDRLSTYGIGQDIESTEWRGVFRQLIAQGYLVTNLEQHGALQLTPKCRPLLKGEVRIQFRRQQKPDKSSAEKKSAKQTRKLRTFDEPLVEALREKRHELAQALDIPAYMIFHNTTLDEMARVRPQTLEQMRYISGVGEQKLNRYGDDFLRIIQDNPLPELLDNKLSDTVNETLSFYLQGQSVEAIATKRELKLSTVYSHLADAIEAGLLEVREVLTLEDQTFEEIVNTMELMATCEEGRVKPVYEAYEGAYDYGVLKCIMASLCA